MNKLILISVVALSLVGCGESKIVEKIRMERYCFDETIEARVSFVLQCVKDSNPMSDEEPEDWIEECSDTAERLYCPKAEVIQVWRVDSLGSSSYMYSKPKPLEGGE